MKLANRTILTLALFAAACSADPLKFDNPSITGTVALESIEGLNDYSRVRVDIGRGEGGVPVAADGSFTLSDLQADAYTVAITYAGGLTGDATGSGYRPYQTLVVAKLGVSINLGRIALERGRGTIAGDVTFSDGSPSSNSRVRLTGAGLTREAVVAAGKFTFANVPVGRYEIRVDRPDASVAAAGACSAGVTVSYDGHTATSDAFLLDVPAIALSAPASVVTDGSTWFVDADSTSIIVDAPFATKVRVWSDADLVPAYGPLSAGGYPITGLMQGTRTRINVQLADACSYESAIRSIDIVRDASAPTLSLVELAGGARYTRATTVPLLVAAEDDLAGGLQMKAVPCDVDDMGAFACAPTLAASAWTDHTFVTPMTFSASQGRKGVQVQLRDRVGNETDVVTREIIYDSMAPANVVITVGDGSGVIRDLATRVTIAANDVQQMKVGTAAGLAAVPWSPFVPSFDYLFSAPDGPKQLYFRLRDDAGNETSEFLIEVLLDTTGTLTGRFLREGSTDHRDIDVSLRGTPFAVTTSSTGRWTIDDVPAGRYDVEASASGHRTFVLYDLVVPAAATRDVGDIELTASSGRITGAVILEGRTDHGGVEVRLGGTTVATFTDASGVFVLNAPADTYNAGLVAAKPRFSNGVFNAPILVRDQQSFNVGELRMIATHNDLIGRVRVAGTTDYSGVAVRAVRDLAGSSVVIDRTVSTDATGDYRFADLPIGAYRIEMSVPSNRRIAPRAFAGIGVGAGPATELEDALLVERYLEINGGADGTGDRAVIIDLGTTDCLEVRIANGADPSGAAWQPCPTAPLPWMLSANSGTKTVSAQFRTTGLATLASPIVADDIELDVGAVISSFTQNARSAVTTGANIHFRMVTGEPGGTATVDIPNYESGIALRDDGIGGDAVANDGTYELDYRVTGTADVVNATVVGTFTDRYGNQATRNAPWRLTIRTNPLVYDVTVETDVAAGTATVRWKTNEPTTTTFFWSAVGSAETRETISDSLEDHAHTFGTNLQPGLLYQFRIDARDGSASRHLTRSHPFYLAPPAPVQVAAIAGDNEVVIRWESVSRAHRSGFTVYRGATSGGPYTALNATPYDHEAHVYTDATAANGTTYYYVTRAIGISGALSVESAEVSATPSAATTGPTTVQGTLPMNAVWSAAGSPYIVAGDVTVPAGGLLAIGPGAQVQFQSGRSILVDGRLAAIGAPSRRVAFVSAQATPAAGQWEQIDFRNTSPSGESDRTDGAYASGNLFYYAEVRHGGTTNPNAGAINSTDSSVAIVQSILSDHTNAAVRAVGTDLLVKSSTISDSQEGVRTNDSTAIFDSVLTRMSLAAVAYLPQAHAPAPPVLVTRTRITNNADGIVGVGSSVARTISISDCQITDNTGFGNSIPGLVRSSMIVRNAMGSSTNSKTVIVDSTVDGDAPFFGCTEMVASTVANVINMVSCRRMYNSSVTQSAAGTTKLIAAASFGPDFGDLRYNTLIGVVPTTPIIEINGFDTAVTSNNIVAPAGSTGALTSAGSTYSFTEALNATGNYWGPTISAEMSDRGPSANISSLYDYYDDIELARVDYRGWTTGQFAAVRTTSPRWGATFEMREPIVFSGHATDPEDGVLGAASLQWRDENGTVIGTGASLVVTDVQPGDHRFWLFAIDSDGQHSGVPIDFTVLD